MKTIFAHLGGFRMWEEARILYDLKNSYFDTAYTHMLPDEKLYEIVNEIGIKRVLFGTDFPWYNPNEFVVKIRRIFEEKAVKILRENALKLINKN